MQNPSSLHPVDGTNVVKLRPATQVAPTTSEPSGVARAESSDALGTQSVLESICTESYGPVLDRVIDRIAPHLGGT
jgi:hypothetical protein